MTATSVAEQIRARLRVRNGLPNPDERRRIREAAGLSRRELADAIGVTRQAVGHWETGARQTPRGQLLDRYVAALRALQEAA
ncbi:transcriptional regulator with XRE-family HTH domain [Kitasatospora sp. GP30]|uniref:helix-turn-helix transcriptional regulator n=1 Tax=Kitasatospora sp. GP30 TaxID=3035084 RepID=UPI000C70241B|nr:helix-turn-helix transcriptional regulator [Kitasatospora sp. GP30]MDH6141008.1 transcriptional regulator with XRE-family HTH domain [Kitasatospora sp. GP30]